MSNTRSAGKANGDARHAAHGDGEPAVEAGMSRDNVNIPLNVVKAGIAGYSEQDQEDLLWLWGYIRDSLHSSRSAACELLACDYTTLTRIFGGRYGASIARFMEAVQHIRRKSVTGAAADFVETVVTTKIWQVLDLARDTNAIVHICGPSGRSKTHAAREWQRRNNHGRAIYIDCPVMGGTRVLLDELAKRAGINTGRKTSDIARRIESSFDWRNTLIIDEAVRLIPQGRGRDLKPLEFLRRLHDVCGCGVCFISTDVFREEMEHGAISSFLEQLLGRIEEPLVIPEKVSLQEAREICRAFNPAADDELVSMAAAIANRKGRVRLLFTLIRQAAKLAASKGVPLAAPHLKTAVAYRENLHRWPES